MNQYWDEKTKSWRTRKATANTSGQAVDVGGITGRIDRGDGRDSNSRLLNQAAGRAGDMLNDDTWGIDQAAESLAFDRAKEELGTAAKDAQRSATYRSIARGNYRGGGINKAEEEITGKVTDQLRKFQTDLTIDQARRRTANQQAAIAQAAGIGSTRANLDLANRSQRLTEDQVYDVTGENTVSGANSKTSRDAQVASLVGEINGQKTLAGRAQQANEDQIYDVAGDKTVSGANSALSRDAQISGITGKFDGQDTMQAKAQDARISGYYSGTDPETGQPNSHINTLERDYLDLSLAKFDNSLNQQNLQNITDFTKTLLTGLGIANDAGLLAGLSDWIKKRVGGGEGDEENGDPNQPGGDGGQPGGDGDDDGGGGGNGGEGEGGNEEGGNEEEIQEKISQLNEDPEKTWATFRKLFGKTKEDPSFDPLLDFDDDGAITHLDLKILGEKASPELLAEIEKDKMVESGDDEDGGDGKGEEKTGPMTMDDWDALQAAFGGKEGDAKYNPNYDFDNDNDIDIHDFIEFGKQAPLELANQINGLAPGNGGGGTGGQQPSTNQPPTGGPSNQPFPNDTSRDTYVVENWPESPINTQQITDPALVPLIDKLQKNGGVNNNGFMDMKVVEQMYQGGQLNQSELGSIIKMHPDMSIDQNGDVMVRTPQGALNLGNLSQIATQMLQGQVWNRQTPPPSGGSGTGGVDVSLQPSNKPTVVYTTPEETQQIKDAGGYPSVGALSAVVVRRIATLKKWQPYEVERLGINDIVQVANEFGGLQKFMD